MARSEHLLPVAAPYRLDLTVSALRRLPTNVVDIFTPAGQYLRAFGTADGTAYGTAYGSAGGPPESGPVIVRVTQTRPDALAVTIEGDACRHAWALGLVEVMLGVDRDLTHFTRAAARMPWLEPLALRMLGVKPPRYPSLWEAFVNAIVFQQVSLHAASTIARRVIVALGSPLERDDMQLYPFPSASRFLEAEDGILRATGLSAAKVAALRCAAEALESGALDDAMLAKLSSPDAATLLQKIRGVGPWTATVILLRGLGRLDVFPMNDSSVTRNLALFAGAERPTVGEILGQLGPQRGMLYYHLLLARLEAKGEVWKR